MNFEPIQPTPEQIRALRKSLGMTQTQYGELVYSKLRTVQDWEGGLRTMHLSTWELLHIKARQRASSSNQTS